MYKDLSNVEEIFSESPYGSSFLSHDNVWWLLIHSFHRVANSMFGKIARITSEEYVGYSNSLKENLCRFYYTVGS